MKKILIIFIVLFLSAYAHEAIPKNDYESFMKTLKLSKRQEKNIAEIENKYRKELVELSTLIILKETQNAQLRGVQHADTDLKYQIKNLQKNRDEIFKEKNKEIMKNLGLLQKIKFKKFVSNLK